MPRPLAFAIIPKINSHEVHYEARIASVADRVLHMCFRAFDYLPPVDVTFGDFLRALVTMDFELSPDDRDELRFAMIEQFGIRGIYPQGTFSLAEESLILPTADDLPELPEAQFKHLTFQLLVHAASALDWSSRLSVSQKQRITFGRQQKVRSGQQKDSLQAYLETVIEHPELVRRTRGQTPLVQALTRYAQKNAMKLGLRRDAQIVVAGFHPVFRIDRDQRLVVELVAQFVQTIPGTLNGRPDVG